MANASEPVTTFPLSVMRTRTVTGWEWFLTVGGERVVGSGGVGLFTEGEAAKPEDMLTPLLKRASKS